MSNWVQILFVAISSLGGGSLFGLKYGAWQGALFAAVLIASLLFVGALRTQRELDRIDAAPRPHLRFLEVEHADETWAERVVCVNIIGGGGPQESVRHLPRRFARVQIANAPPVGVLGENAREVAAELTFSGAGIKTRTMGGHWCLHAEGPNRKKAVWNPPIDLPANGQAQGLDIAMQDPEDGATYAFNDLNRKGHGARLPAHALAGKECLVTVKLRPSNDSEETTAMFRLYLGGKDDPMRLERIEG